MTSDVVLTSALRANLLSLQNTQNLIDTTQFKLATGRKVNSALDNPQNFFASQSLNNRATDLSRLLDGIGQSIQSIQQADQGIQSLTKLVEQADAIAQQAREAIAQGGTEARISGNRNLNGVTDLTTLAGITAGDALVFSITDPENPGTLVDFDITGATATTTSITIAANDSIEQLITKINDIQADTTNGDVAVVNASLDSDGNLEIKTLNGGDVKIEFLALANNDTTNLAFAADLGFGGSAQAVGDNGAANQNNIEVTASASSALTSFALYNNTSNRIALRSDALTGLVNNDNTSQVLFANTGNAADQFTISVNGGTAQTVSLNAQTIQGFIDGINDNDSINTQIKASFDDVTGQVKIDRLSANVDFVTIGAESNAATDDFNFGFGVTAFDNVSNTANIDLEETIRFGSAAAQLKDLEDEFNNIRTQTDQLVDDTGYRGINLLNGDKLDTFFNESRTSSLSTEGGVFTSQGLGISEANFASTTTVDAALVEIREATDKLRTFGSSIANDLAIIQTREDFTTSTIQNLQSGSDRLTIADQNEEGANLLALQTRQQLGVTSLSLASQSQQAVLRLF